MSSSQASGRIRAAGLAGIAIAAVLLAGCTSDFLSSGGGTEPLPTESAATPEPSATVDTPDPADDLDCVNLLIDRPGNYVIGDCGTVTLEGTGIRLTFASIGELVLRGDGADVVGETLGSLQIDGQGADISAYEIGDVVIRGDDHVVVAETTIESVDVSGNGNVVSAGDGITLPVVDDGLLNEIG